MDVAKLRNEVRAGRSDVVPFVGSGLALDAGAPRANALTDWLADRFGVTSGMGADLLVLTAQIVEEHGEAALQAALAEHFAGLRMRPTPALIALSACPRRVVVTTNYDDAIEVAARARGVDPISLLATDPRILRVPEPGTMHVVHAHGLIDQPETLVLPGRQMARLADDSPFVTFMRSTLAAAKVLYLGFSLGAAEVHLRGIVLWLDARVPDAPAHWLLLPASEAAARSGDLAPLAVSKILSIIAFDDSQGFGAVEDVALQLAPRAAQALRDPGEAERMTWVQPLLLEPGPTDNADELARRMLGVTLGWGTDEPVLPEQLADRLRTVLVGGPGAGKSTLLGWLPRLTKSSVALGTLRDFSPVGRSEPARAVLRLLRASDGGALPAELWDTDGLVVALDGLEEVDADMRTAALCAVLAIADGRRHVLVAARPTEQVAALRDAGFDVVHLVPSHRWATAYLRTRAVPSHRVDRVLLGQHGLGELLTVPAFAALLADSLLDDPKGDIAPLRLLVDAQEQAITEEARRAGEPADVLSRWARDLAVGLQLTGRTSVRVEALAAPGDDERRRRLVAASVLGDVAGHAAFSRHTSQEALVADEILAATDVAAAFRFAAVATVGGRDVIRADFDLVADLVFEHAAPEGRRTLRNLDELRWARTAVGGDEPGEAEEALDLLERWHADRDLDWVPSFRRDGLRSASGAVSALLARWSAVGVPRIARWRDDLATGATSARLRALTALTAAHDGDDFDWLLGALDDPEAAVQARAAAAAARLEIVAAIPRLLELLDARDDRLRRTALVALVDLLPSDQLDRIGVLVRGSDPLRPVHERLEERISLDAGLRLLAARHSLEASDAWLLDRLIARTHRLIRTSIPA